jgi:hypothetical protein
MVFSPKAANILWWALYCIAAMNLQLHFPGIDAMAPGIMLSCQEKRPRQTAWLCLVTILIQEGAGSLAFGNALLWYGSLLFFFFAGGLFFVTGSLFFVVLLALVLGAAHSGILYVTSSLQGVAADTHRLAHQAVAQALFIPPFYAAASFIRKRFLNHEYGI